MNIRELEIGTQVSFKNMEHNESIDGKISCHYPNEERVVVGVNQDGKDCYVPIQRLATDPAWIQVETNVPRFAE